MVATWGVLTVSVQVRKGGELQTQDLGEGVISAFMMAINLTIVSISIPDPNLLPAATVPASTWQPHHVTNGIGSVPLSVDAATEKDRSFNLNIILYHQHLPSLLRSRPGN